MNWDFTPISQFILQDHIVFIFQIVTFSPTNLILRLNSPHYSNLKLLNLYKLRPEISLCRKVEHKTKCITCEKKSTFSILKTYFKIRSFTFRLNIFQSSIWNLSENYSQRKIPINKENLRIFKIKFIVKTCTHNASKSI